ncbi:MAG: hypothetical protein ACR2QG_03745 [Gammaproteobacteria bacterium]
MLTKLNRFIINASISWKMFLLVVAGQAATMGVMMGYVNQQFPAESGGNLPFDMQNDLTVEQIFSQLESYTDKAFELYTIFQIADYVFPVVAGLVLAIICAFGLRNTSEKFYTVAIEKNLFIYILIPTLFDWLENLSLLCVVVGWPEKMSNAATIAVIAKQGKLGTLNISFAVAGILLITGLIGWTRNQTRKRTEDFQP